MSLEFFGLDASATQRDVKRAYATRLKVTRPEDDARAFAELNDAYQSALSEVRWQEYIRQYEEEEEEVSDPVVYGAHGSAEVTESVEDQSDDYEIDDEPEGEWESLNASQIMAFNWSNLHPSSGWDDAPVSAADSFDIETFLVELKALLIKADSNNLKSFLEENESLYNLELKEFIGSHLMWWLPSDIDLILQQNDAKVLEEFFQRPYWDQLGDQFHSRESLRKDIGHVFGRFTTKHIQMLKRPLTKWHRLRIGLSPTLKFQLRRLLESIEYRLEGVPSSLNSETVEFVRDVGVFWRRSWYALYSALIILISINSLLMAGLLSHRSDDDSSLAANVWMIIVSIVVLFFVGRALQYWQNRDTFFPKWMYPIFTVLFVCVALIGVLSGNVLIGGMFAYLGVRMAQKSNE